MSTTSAHGTIEIYCIHPIWPSHQLYDHMTNVRISSATIYFVSGHTSYE